MSMKITLKNVKVHRDLSEETLWFSASIYLDGKKAGTVSNRGCGGCNEYYWKNRIPLIPTGDSLDEKIDDLLNEAEEKKQFKRWCKTKTVFALKGDEAGTFRTIAHRFTQEVKDFLHRKHGNKLARIVNEEL